MVRHLRARQALDTVQEQASEQLLPEQSVAYIRQSSTKQVENNPESAVYSFQALRSTQFRKGWTLIRS